MKLTTIFWSLVLMFFSLSCLQAQGIYSIRGTVLDEAGRSVEAGNVMVLSYPDSSLVTGTFFLDGTFAVEAIELSHFLLRITALGYADEFIEVEMEGNSVLDLGAVVLSGNATLKEVVVTSVVSGVEGEAGNGKVVFSIKEQGGYVSASASEIVEKLPGVFRDHNGQLSVFGRGAVEVLINGRKPAPGALESLRVEDIASVELITNPDARYQAAGKGGVVNIITRKDASDGVYYQFRTMLTKAAFERAYFKGNVSYQKGKWHWFGGLSYNPQKILFQDFYLREFRDSTGQLQFSFDNELEKTRTFLTAFRYDAGFAWTLNPKSLLNFKYSGYRFGNDEFTSNTNHLTYASLGDLTLDTRTQSDYRYGAHTFDLEYRCDFDSSGVSSLSFFNSATWFDAGRLDDILSSITDANGGTSSQKISNLTDEKIVLYYSQLDYSFPLWQKGGVLTIGGRYDFADKQSSLMFEESENAAENTEDVYTYKEQIEAAFTQWNMRQGPWSVGLGLRAESSSLKGASTQTNFEIDTSSLLFFPSASLSYSFSDEWKANASYAKRIVRPTFQELNPFTIYIDSFSFFKGNPRLVPEIAHSYEFSLVYREVASLRLGLTDAVNPMFLTVQQEGLKTIALTDNLRRSKRFYLSLTLPYETKRWTTYNVFGWTKDRFSYSASSKEETVFQSPMWYVYLYNEFRLPLDFSTSFLFQYVSDGVNGVFDFREKWVLKWTLQKKFAEGRWLVGLIVNDPFRTDLLRSHTALGNLDVYYDAYTDRRYVRLFAKYSFGKPLKEGMNKKSENINRIKVK